MTHGNVVMIEGLTVFMGVLVIFGGGKMCYFRFGKLQKFRIKSNVQRKTENRSGVERDGIIGMNQIEY